MKQLNWVFTKCSLSLFCFLSLSSFSLLAANLPDQHTYWKCKQRIIYVEYCLSLSLAFCASYMCDVFRVSMLVSPNAPKAYWWLFTNFPPIYVGRYAMLHRIWTYKISSQQLHVIYDMCDCDCITPKQRSYVLSINFPTSAAFALSLSIAYDSLPRTARLLHSQHWQHEIACVLCLCATGKCTVSLTYILCVAMPCHAMPCHAMSLPMPIPNAPRSEPRIHTLEEHRQISTLLYKMPNSPEKHFEFSSLPRWSV